MYLIVFFANCENVQTVYKVYKLMYCAIVHMFVKIVLTLFMSISIVCVHSCLRSVFTSVLMNYTKLFAIATVY